MSEMSYAKPVASFDVIAGEFTERVRALVLCTAATVDTRDRPRTRVWHPIWEGKKTGRIATSRDTLKTRHLSRSPYLSLSYLDAHHLLRLGGRGVKARLRQEEYDLFMPEASYKEFVAAQQ